MCFVLKTWVGVRQQRDLCGVMWPRELRVSFSGRVVWAAWTGRGFHVLGVCVQEPGKSRLPEVEDSGWVRWVRLWGHILESLEHQATRT